MPHVHFSKNFNWRKSQHVSTAYKADKSYLVSEAAAKAAVAEGAGEILERDPSSGRPRRRQAARDGE